MKLIQPEKVREVIEWEEDEFELGEEYEFEEEHEEEGLYFSKLFIRNIVDDNEQVLGDVYGRMIDGEKVREVIINGNQGAFFIELDGYSQLCCNVAEYILSHKTLFMEAKRILFLNRISLNLEHISRENEEKALSLVMKEADIVIYSFGSTELFDDFPERNDEYWRNYEKMLIELGWQREQTYRFYIKGKGELYNMLQESPLNTEHENEDKADDRIGKRFEIEEQRKINSEKVRVIMHNSPIILERDLEPLDITKEQDLIEATNRTIAEFCMLSEYERTLETMQEEFDRMLQLNRPDLWINEYTSLSILSNKMAEFEDNYIHINRELYDAFERTRSLVEEVEKDLLFIFDKVIKSNSFKVKSAFFGRKNAEREMDWFEERVALVIELSRDSESGKKIAYRETYNNHLNKFKKELRKVDVNI